MSAVLLSLRFVCICITVLLSVSYIGYQSLLPLLENEDIFSSLCNSNESTPCQKQSLRLDLMYTLSISAGNVAYLLFSVICFKFGSKISLLIGSLLVTISCIVFSFGYDWPSFLSYITMAIGSTGIIFGLIGIPSEYPQKYQGVLYSLFIGCIDASSGITYIFLLLHNNLSISLQILYISLAICVAVSSLFSYFFVFSKQFTDKRIKLTTVDDTAKDIIVQLNHIDTTPNKNDIAESLISDIDIQSRNLYASISSAEMTGYYSIHYNSSWKITFCSKQFISITIWSMFYMTTKYFYIATLEDQLRWITNNNEDQIHQAQEVFSIMLFLSGLCTIITGPIIDQFGMKFSLMLMGIMSVIISICSVIELYDIQLFITMIGMVFNRFFYLSMLPLLIVTIFGATRQQFLYGIVLFLSACFNLTGILYEYIAANTGDYTSINLITGLCCLLAAFWLTFTLRNNPMVT